MNININVLCSACKDCSRIKIEKEMIYADNTLFEIIFYCEHLHECENAVNIWKDRENEHI